MSWKDIHSNFGSCINFSYKDFQRIRPFEAPIFPCVKINRTE